MTKIEHDDHGIASNSNRCIFDNLKRWAEKSPDSIAIAAPERSPITYKRLYNQICYVVDFLRSRGVHRMDRLAIVLPNGPEMAVTFLAASSCAASAPLNPSYSAIEYDFYLSDLNAKALIVQSEMDSPARAVAESRGIEIIELSPSLSLEAGMFRLHGGDVSSTSSGRFAESHVVALVLHTSGTTSRPKIVALTHKNLLTSTHNIINALELDTNDRCLNIMPLFHIHGLMAAVLSSLVSGGSVVCTPGSYAPRFFEWIQEFKPTWYTAVPTMHQSILDRSHPNLGIIRSSPLRFIRSSSSALPMKVMADLQNVFKVPVIESYGMTEASHQMTSNPLPPRVQKPGSVGLPAGPDVSIMNGEGNLLTTGEIGEIVIRGENVSLGYENNPESNKVAFTNGWFRTGDEGYFDEDGYLFITGRIKEIINRGGEKISPREVEEVIMDHPSVQQVVVFAVPHPELGEEIGAAVVLSDNPSLTESEIRQQASTKLANFKVPRHIVIVDEIPKGATGKLQRIGMADKLGIASSGQTEKKAEFRAPTTPLEKKIAEIWYEVLGLEEVGIHDNFLQLGGDSILAAQIINRVREELQVELPLLVFIESPTIADMTMKIAEIQREKARPEDISQILDELEALSEEDAQKMLSDDV
jgi:acyl-CoA synthetase (AMP-forming)/AMP-acid ligase II/acyl carrier protein